MLTGARPTVSFDHHSAAFAEDPWPTLQDLRRRCPVSYSTEYGGFWVLTRYEDIRAVVEQPVKHAPAAEGECVGCHAPHAARFEKLLNKRERALCATCHQEAFKAWQASYHSKMVRPLKEGLLKDALDNWAKDSKGQPGPTKGNIDGKPYRLEDVVYVIGSKWKQRYLVKNPATGNHQFMDKQWNRGSRLWENYGQKNDWETQCTTCHATGFRITSYDPKNTAAMKVTMSERNTGCEACHGPGGDHVAARGKAPIFNPSKAPKAEADKVCGYCHLRGENDNWLTAQGNHSEHLPHPVMGETYKAGQDDWTKWYPNKVLLPGIQPEDRAVVEKDIHLLADPVGQRVGVVHAGSKHGSVRPNL